MTESWMSNNNHSNRVISGNLVPQVYKIIHIPRPKGRGGCVGVVFKATLHLQIDAVVNIIFII